MEPMTNHSQFCNRTRREFLWEMGAGFTGVALAGILQRDGFAFGSSTPAASPLTLKQSHFPAKAKSVIFLFMYGGPSQVDLFDYKPELQKRDGQSVNLEIRRGSIQQKIILGSKRAFKQHGQSGLWMSDCFPHLSQHADKLAVIKSLYADSFPPGSAMIQINSAQIIQAHPPLGAWMGYALVPANQNPPGFVVMLDPRGGPTSGAANWSSGYMPA